MNPVVRTSDSPLVLTPDASTSLAAPPVSVTRERDIVEEWGVQSFPASDPPANW
jgi:hypothetical protein